MSVFSKIKKWLTKKPKDNKIKEANRVTNYGGGVSSKSVQKEVKRSIDKAEAKKRGEKQTEYQQSVVSKSNNTAFKATPPSVRKAEAKDRQTSKKSDPFNAKNAFKASAQPKFSHQSTALGTMSTRDINSRIAKRNAADINQKYRSRAADKLKPLIDEKYSGDTKESKRRIKSGEYWSDPNVMKYETLKHPLAMSAARGQLNAWTLGAADALAKYGTKGEQKEAEDLYQANKNKFVEGASEMAGTLASFALTGGASKALFGKVAPNKVARLGEEATELLAKNGIVRGAAEREALRKLGTTATKAEIEHFARSKAAKIVAAIGGDMAVNLTTGGAYDILTSAAESDNPAEFFKNLGLNAATNVVLGGITSSVPVLRGSNVDDAFVRNRLAAREGLDDLAKRNRIGMGRPSELTLPKLNAVPDAADAVARYPAIEDAYLDYDGTTAAVNRYYNPDDTAEAAVDRYHDLDIQRAKPKAEPPKAEAPKEEVKAEEPTAEVAAEPPKARSKKKKTPPTREERLANSNGIDQYNARAEHQAERFQEGYEKADNIRAELEKKPAKGAKKKAETLNVKAEAKAETPAPKAETPNKPKKTIDLNESVGKKRVKKTAKEQVTDFVSSVKTKISDSLDAFEKENRKLVHSDHQKWLDNNGAIDKARRYNSIANRSLEDGQVKWKGGRFENSKGLKQIYEGMDESTEKAFDQYLLMKHAPDRIREGKPIFSGTQFDDPEVCKREAARLLKEHPEFAERAEEIYKFTRNELQNRVDAGLLKQEVADEWNKKYPFYVPTGRDGEFGGDYDVWDLVGQLKNESNTVGAGKIKAAKGGEAPIRSIKEQLAEATTRNWRDMSMNNLFRRMFGENAGKELAENADGGVERVLDNTINLSKSKGGKHYAEVFENGEMRRVEIEKRFYDAIEDLYKNGRFGNGWDVAADAASKVATPFKQLVTSWNPIFMVKNGMRDFPEAIINSRQTKEFVTCMPAAMKELTEGGEWLQAFRDSGVSQANLVNLEETLTKSKGRIGKAIDKFVTAQEAVETYPRLVEFMATVKKAGYNLEDGIANVPMEILDRAAANAADVTVNFGRSGSVGKMLNRGFVPFFNPSIQGWSKFLRNFSEQEGAKAYTSFAVKALALGAGVQTVNNLVLEDNPNYQRISARDKATNIIIPLTAGKEKTLDNTDTFIKIPKSRFAAVFGLPVVNVGNENKIPLDTVKGWAEMIKVTKDQIAPVDPSESSIFAPFMDATKSKEGETWYGTPIVPQALVDLPKSEQYDVNTSNIGKALGKATSKLPNELQISPKKADYIIDAETGVVGDFLLPMATPSRQGGGKGLKKYAAPVGNVLKKSFTIDSVTQNDLSTRFYDQVEKANTNNQSSKAGKAESDEYKRLNSFSTEVSGLNKAIKYLQGTKRETKLEDVRELQKFRNQIMQDAIDGKDSPNSVKTMNAVQKSVGTTYAINNFGSSADQKAMKLYGLAKYGDISDKAMRKSIDADKDFYKGIKSIGKLNGKIAKAGITSNTTLTKAVALASSDSNDELFGAYGATNKSRTESANKMVRARNYFKEGGSNDEYVKLETARRTLGKLSADDETKALNKIDKQLAKGEITLAEHDKQEKSIKYNANLSYVGLAASLAAANAPERGYRLYDIKDKNIQKGINLTAMGFTARDYKEMSKALDTNGNGYPSKQEIVDYVSKSNVKDKATLFDALYYYQGKSNPFGTPTNYTREQAALMGKKNGVKAISGTSEKMNLNPETSSGSGYRGYYRGGYRRWHSWGGGRSRKGRQPISANNSAFKAKKANISGSSSPKMSVSGASNISRTSARTSSSPKIDVTPLKIKTVKPSSARGSSSNLAGALEDIRTTEKKVTPPKARKNK